MSGDDLIEQSGGEIHSISTETLEYSFPCRCLRFRLRQVNQHQRALQ